MFYVSNIIGTRYFVTDSEDGVTECYTKEQVLAFHDKGLKVYGVQADRNVIIPSPYDVHKLMIESIVNTTYMKVNHMRGIDTASCEKIFNKACAIAYKESYNQVESFWMYGQKVPYKGLNLGLILSKVFTRLFGSELRVLLISTLDKCENDILYFTGAGNTHLEESKRCFYENKIASVDFKYKLKDDKDFSHIFVHAYTAGYQNYLLVFDNENNINKFKK